jgi:hypothetical protein
MLLLTNILLLGVAFVFGFARRPWWQVGVVAFVANAPVQFVQFWMGDWRYRVGLSYHEQSLGSQELIWIVGSILCFTYVGYALGILYSRWRRTLVGERSPD